MQQIKHEHVVTSSTMDTIVPRSNVRKRWLIAVAVGVIVIPAALWQLVPRGLRVNADTLRWARVEQSFFSNNIALRGTANSLNSVVLDAVDSGRVEEVSVKDGATVSKGQLLFRLSNPQRDLELLARESDYATQIANRANLEVSLETSIVARQRRLIGLQFNVDQTEKQFARNTRLAEQGFISQAVLDESEDKLAQHRLLLQEEALVERELAIKRNALRQMERSTERLASGIRLINAGVDALAVRAPAPGRLAEFNLQVGETIKAGQNVGRIDDPKDFKLRAQVDEYYLNKVAVGQLGQARIDARQYQVSVNRVFPQIRNAQFAVDIVFSSQHPPSLHPGQSVDVELSLGASSRALVLPAGTYVNESGTAGLFVRTGGAAHRRAVRLGRRNGKQVEVLHGLQAGDEVIVSDYARYGSATTLQIAD